MTIFGNGSLANSCCIYLDVSHPCEQDGVLRARGFDGVVWTGERGFRGLCEGGRLRWVDAIMILKFWEVMTVEAGNAMG